MNIDKIDWPELTDFLKDPHASSADVYGKGANGYVFEVHLSKFLHESCFEVNMQVKNEWYRVPLIYSGDCIFIPSYRGGDIVGLNDGAIRILGDLSSSSLTVDDLIREKSVEADGFAKTITPLCIKWFEDTFEEYPEILSEALAEADKTFTDSERKAFLEKTHLGYTHVSGEPSVDWQEVIENNVRHELLNVSDIKVGGLFHAYRVAGEFGYDEAGRVIAKEYIEKFQIPWTADIARAMVRQDFLRDVLRSDSPWVSRKTGTLDENLSAASLASTVSSKTSKEKSIDSLDR